MCSWCFTSLGLGALVWQPWEAQAAAEAVDPEDGLNTP